MHIDFKEILSAWAAKINPTPDQKDLALRRAKICDECEFLGEVLKDKKMTQYCKECGCVIGAKIYSYKEGACPKNKWDRVDCEFRNSKAIKVLKHPRSIV